MSILETIVEHKRAEIQKIPDMLPHVSSDRSFLESITNTASMPVIIAEIKPKSPISGPLLPLGFSVSEIASSLETAGASALSILTDEHFFGGSFQNIETARASTSHIPLLCKDFVLSPKQIRKARIFGADSFLLIAKILSATQIQELLDEGRKWNMEALVEIADENDWKKTEKTDAKIIGINNRNLHDFSLTVSRTLRFAKHIPKEKIIVSLSGFSGADIRLVRGVTDAVLIGTDIGRVLSKGKSISSVLKKYTSPSPLLKTCGVRSISDLEYISDLSVPLVGVNMVPSSHRCASAEFLQELKHFSKKNIQTVGVFQNHSPDEVLSFSTKYNLDFVQLSGEEQAQQWSNFPYPIIKGLSFGKKPPISEERHQWEDVADIYIYDGKTPGSGQSWDTTHISEFTKLACSKPFLIAGGVTAENMNTVLHQTGADGVDLATGLESNNGKWDLDVCAQCMQNILSA